MRTSGARGFSLGARGFSLGARGFSLGARGFSLIELMVALMIIAISFTVLFSSLSGSLRNIGRIDDFERRVQAADAKLAELDLVQSFRPGDTADGTFEDGTQWKMEVSAFLSPPPTVAAISAVYLVRIALTLEWESRAGHQSWTVDTYRSTLPGVQPRPLRDQMDALR